MHILITDDDANIRRSLAAHLEDAGHTVTHAGDGKQAVAKFAKINPDMVLMDLQMPNLDGISAIKAMLEHKPETPIIVISGAGRVTDAIEAIRSGAWDYIVKPIDDLSILTLAIDRAVERQSLRRQVADYQSHLEEQVKQRTADLEAANESLQNKTIALREVAASVQTEKRAAIQEVATEIEQSVLPLIRRLKESAAPISRPIIENIEQYLRRIAQAQVDSLGPLAGGLTPAELRICRLLRREMSSKEIAQAEGISPDTVETHRRNIRRKLKIANENVNLTTYLQSLSELAG
jgi:DNA-binding NarL/FixJ family response regulator